MTAPAVRWRAWPRAARWLALLGPFFYLSYGVANHWAGTRGPVPSVVYDWERQIPFWAWTIFPYWTINAFYALSLFLSRNRHEMDRHAARLLTAQCVAVACFMLWPLQFSFGQPAVDGPSAFLFNALRGFDKPFNQAPSLHIALTIILWDWYRRRIGQSAWAHAVLHLWAFAIAASVLTTWQHHFIDIPTGALLGLLCVWLWPIERRVAPARAWRTTRDPRRWRLALLYALGGVLCLALALHSGGVGGWLAWPAVSLLLVALNYAGLGALGFAMGPDGRMHWATRWLFAPYRLAAAINAWLWTRRLPAATEILPGVRLGRLPTRAEWEAAGRPRVLSLCAELQAPPMAGARCVPMLDLVAPTPTQLRRAVGAIETARARGESLWICCALGFSRSAGALVGWMASRDPAAGWAGAEARVRTVRPQIVLPAFWRRRLERLQGPKEARRD